MRDGRLHLVASLGGILDAAGDLGRLARGDRIDNRADDRPHHPGEEVPDKAAELLLAGLLHVRLAVVLVGVAAVSLACHFKFTRVVPAVASGEFRAVACLLTGERLFPGAPAAMTARAGRVSNMVLALCTVRESRLLLLIIVSIIITPATLLEIFAARRPVGVQFAKAHECVARFRVAAALAAGISVIDDPPIIRPPRIFKRMWVEVPESDSILDVAALRTFPVLFVVQIADDTNADPTNRRRRHGSPLAVVER